MDRKSEDHDDPRRRVLINCSEPECWAQRRIACTGGQYFWHQTRLPPGQSVMHFGSATVNGMPASLNTKINLAITSRLQGQRDRIRNQRAGDHPAWQQQCRFEAERRADSLIVSGLRMLTGAMLSVSRNQPMRLRTPTATIGIRGTGFTSKPNLSKPTLYLLWRNGSRIGPTRQRKRLRATMHDRLVYIDARTHPNRGRPIHQPYQH